MSRAQKEVIFRQFDRWGWDERGYSRVTSYTYISICRGADRWLEENRAGRSIFSAHYDDIKAYLFSTKPSARRRNQIRQGLVSFLDYLVAEGYRADNPARELPRLREPKKVTRAAGTGTAAQLWAEVKTEHPMITALYGVYFWGGLRRTEGRCLRWDQIDLDAIIVEGKGSGVREGRGKERRVPIHPELDWALRRWRKECPDAKYVFPSPRRPDQPISEGWARKRLAELGKRFGIRLHPHLLRHTIATEMLDRGANIRAVQEFLGHTDLATTQLYVDVRPVRITEAVMCVDLSKEMEPTVAGVD